jgi:hypothetical protein
MKINPETMKAVGTMTDTLAALRRSSQEADDAAMRCAPGSAEELYALQLGRVVRHLGDAVADVPTDLWLAMCRATGQDTEPAVEDLKSKAA